MADQNSKYNGPTLTLDLSSDLAWSVVMLARDASGTRRLGYRAEGGSLPKDVASRDFPIKVHDEDRPVWTTMPLDHRKDLRDAITTILKDAMLVVRALR